MGIMSDSANGLCRNYCVCIRFAIPEESKEQLKKKVTVKESKKKLNDEIARTKIKVRCNLRWMKSKKEKEKRLFVISMVASNKHFTDEDFSKCFSILQKRIDFLEQYSIKEFEATTCSRFGFGLKRFKPVGELVLPAKLSLRPQLAEKLGESKVTGFGIDFEESPLGLMGVLLDVREEENILYISLTSRFQTKLENLIKNAYEHGKRISHLFVEERK